MLYEKEVGPKPEKVRHFEIFSSTCSQENLEYDQISVLESILTVITTLGHCSAHGLMVLLSKKNSKNNAPCNLISAPRKNMSLRFEILECARTLSHDHPGLSCHCMPSSVRWTMAPSHVIFLHLPLSFAIVFNRRF